MSILPLVLGARRFSDRASARRT